MQVNGKIQKWGNGLALRVSGLLREVPNFNQDDLVTIEVTESGFTVMKTIENTKEKLPFLEKELLQGLNVDNVHSNLVVDTFLDIEHG